MPFRTLGGGLGNFYNLSDAVLQSHDAEINANELTMTKKKTITITDLATSNSLRIKFDLRCNNVTYTVKGRIYKNGIAIGTLRTEGGTTYVTYSEDLAFAKGDTIELWCMADYAGYPYWIRNFRVHGYIAAASSTGFTGVNS
jgi:hypothetical protein